MSDIINIFKTITERIQQLAKGNAVVAKTISVGDRHVIPLCELSLSCGGFGGSGSDTTNAKDPQSGQGGGVAGGAKTQPVAVIIIDNGKVRVEHLHQRVEL